MFCGQIWGGCQNVLGQMWGGCQNVLRADMGRVSKCASGRYGMCNKMCCVSSDCVSAFSIHQDDGVWRTAAAHGPVNCEHESVSGGWSAFFARLSHSKNHRSGMQFLFITSRRERPWLRSNQIMILIRWLQFTRGGLLCWHTVGMCGKERVLVQWVLCCVILVGAL